MSITENDGALFLGLDSSTQGLKATVIDRQLDVVYETAVNFDRDLPEFETKGGAHRGADGLTVTSPPIMWVAAADLLMARMKTECDLGKVIAVSGSGQQHGSVWLKAGARAALQGLDPQSTLRDQLADVFSVTDSPIWMDSSTGKQCADLEAALGGPQAVADLTGSRAYERFTGNQVAKIHQAQPDAYEATDRIALVSSFIASLLLGDYAPIDASDGSGMNLMDIRAVNWAPGALKATSPDLESKLGLPVASHTTVGRVHPYYVERYGFAPSCCVIAFSGDNPNSLAGLRLQEPGHITISLGTSDTLFGSLAHPSPSGEEGHVFVNPIVPDAFMAMICRKNGSLAREYVRDEVAGGSWDTCAQLVDETPIGNNGKIGMYLLEAEITPPIQNAGIYRFDENDQPVDAFSPSEEARAILEGQFLSMRLHGERIGIEPSLLIATGGASVDASVIKVICDVFGKPVFVAERADSASLGAAYRALHGHACDEAGSFVSFAEALAAAAPFSRAADPDPAAHEVYTGMLRRIDAHESRLMAASA